MAKTKKTKPAIQSKQNKENATGVALKTIAKKAKVAKTDDVKTKKSQVLKESVKEAKIPVKKAKGTALIDKKVNVANSKESNAANKKSSKPCLVLAPPESPVSVEKPKKVPKKTVKNPKLVSVEEPISVGEVTSTVSLNKKATQKPGKKSNQKSGKPSAAKTARGAKEVEKKQKAPTKKIFEPIPFEDEKFDAIVNAENIAKIATALKELVEKEVATKKASIFSDYNYCLNVVSFKIASCPKRMVKLDLKHALVNVANDDVLIVVPDLKRGAKVEYESTIEHYTDLFRNAGIENLKIMPFNQLRQEFKTFESKRKLSNTYDYYLCDGRIAGHVVGFCGSIFQKPRTTFHSVRLNNPKTIKSEIEKSLRRTAYKQLGKGDLITIPVGNDKFKPEDVAQNIVHVVSQLKESFPGGIENVRSMDLKINIIGTSGLPIYASTSNGPEQTPYVVGTREKRVLHLKKEANDILSKFNLTKEAEIQTLTAPQIAQKRKLKEKRAALLAETTEQKDVEAKQETEVVVPNKKPHLDSEGKAKVKKTTKTAAKKSKHA